MPLRIPRLQTLKVNPRLEEVQQFQKLNSTAMDEILSDEDEWDCLADETLMKTIRDDDGLKKFECGDRVDIVSGQYQGFRAIVTK